MIHVARPDEPPIFEERVRKRGNAWLREHPTSTRPHGYWAEVRDALAEAFKERCGYTALWDVNGTVDHFHAFVHARHKAYEWSNYRYATGWVNSSKQDQPPGTYLDPYDVEDGWFEILLPSLELVVAKDRVPPEHLALAEQTLRNLPIGRHPRVLKNRRAFYQKYLNGTFTLEQLRELAPQIAAAVERAALSSPAPIAGPPVPPSE